MSLPRICLLAAVLALSPAFTGGAAAQNFFERLFGIRPAPMPPAPVPQPMAPRPMPGPMEEGVPGQPGGMQPAAPPPPKPVVIRPPTEDSVVGRDLKLNGAGGTLRIERAGQDYRAQVTLEGAKISQPVEACSVRLGDDAPVALTSQGRPEGLARYEVQAPQCPMVFDVVDGGVMVTAPQQACMVEAADCRVEPRGMWGPVAADLLPRARDIEQARGAADRAVRENYKALTQRAGPQGMRPIVSEQAAFSSEREQLCRSYAREGAHGFCNTRFTEARAVNLAARLGVLAAPTAEARPERPRRPRPTSQAPEAGVADPTYIR